MFSMYYITVKSIKRIKYNMYYDLSYKFYSPPVYTTQSLHFCLAFSCSTQMIRNHSYVLLFKLLTVLPISCTVFSSC